MTVEQAAFHSSVNLRIVYRAWLPPGRARAIVLIAHGLGEHSGRYEHVAAALTQAGFSCYGMDQYGHGLSEGARAYVNDAWQAVTDLAQLHDIVRERHGDLPTLLCGHSMGALVGLGFALRHPERLRGLALTGAPLHSELSKPRWLIALCLRAAGYIPKLRLSPPTLPGVLTHDQAQRQAWREDSLVDKGMWRVGTSAELIRFSRQIRARVGELRLPLLLLHGADDHLAPAEGSRWLADNAGSDDITLRIYPELRHELVNEIERGAIIATMRDWLLDVCER